jgi:hypothetical protein
LGHNNEPLKPISDDARLRNRLNGA